MSTHETHERDRALVEAALFLAPQPLTRRGLSKILEGVPLAYIDRMLEELKTEYDKSIHGIELHIEEGRAMLRVKAAHVNAVAHLAPQQDIPRPVLRTLAVIAYNHPMTQADAVRVRGNKAYAHIQELLERGLIRAEDHGRTLLLHVTREFLRHFGLNSVEEFRFHFSAAPEEVEMDLDDETEPSEEESDEMQDSDAIEDGETEGASDDTEDYAATTLPSGEPMDIDEAEAPDDATEDTAADGSPADDSAEDETLDDAELMEAMAGPEESATADEDAEAEEPRSDSEAAEEEEDG